MNNKEAKERFENFGTFCDDYNDACDGDCEKCFDMEDRILEALEKQIPKKPIYVGDTDIFDYVCPTCGQLVYELFDFYCSQCGQKLTDWSEVE